MKKGQDRDYLAQCPYYHKHDKSRIFCSGVGGALTTMQYFETGQQKREYLKKYCETEYCRCPVYKGH